MTKAKKKGWFFTILVLGAVAILSAKNPEKVKEWVSKIPMGDKLVG